MITTETARRFDRESTWHPGLVAGRDHSTDWRNEPRVFAADELGWLGDEARRRLHRSAGRAEAFELLHGLRGDALFARLAAHPRLLRRAAALLGAPAEIANVFVQCGSLVRPDLPTDTDIAIVIVPLGWRAEAPLGGISLGTRPDRRARYEWPLVAIYRPLRTTPPPALDDDCLWPDASIVAG